MGQEQPQWKLIHVGRNIERLRLLIGMKQTTLADELHVSQAFVSQIEQQEIVSDEWLEKIAKVLGVPAAAIKNFSQDAVLNVISNSFTLSDSATNSFNSYPTYHITESNVHIEENKKLYERLLSEKDELIKAKDQLIALLTKDTTKS